MLFRSSASEWSELFGVPLAAYGVAGYLALAVLTVLTLRGRRELQAVLIAAGAGTVLLSAFLFYVSKVQLGFVCSWCLRMYAANLGILVLSALAGRPVRPTPRAVGPRARRPDMKIRDERERCRNIKGLADAHERARREQLGI